MMNPERPDFSRLSEHGDSAVFWDALRYVLGELSPDEAAAFEDRLASNERACAAVAEAVTLCAGLHATVPAPVAHRRELTTRTKSHGGLAVVLCAAAAMLSGIALLSAWRPMQSPHVDLAAVELLDLWVVDNHIPGEHDWRDEMDPEAEILDESLAAPHWLLDAVELTAVRKAPR